MQIIDKIFGLNKKMLHFFFQKQLLLNLLIDNLYEALFTVFTTVEKLSVEWF